MRRQAVGALFLYLAIGVLAVAAVRDASRLGDQLPWRQMGDFSDFYCAGLALDNGQSPYSYEPLHGCEHKIGAAVLLRNNPELVIPAPQPPYVLAPFMLLARMSFSSAALMYACAIIVALMLCAALFTRLGVPLDLALLAFTIPVAYQEVAAGQIVPFALLALVLTGTSLAAGRYRLAGLCAALVMIEPQFGVPVALAVFAYVRASRLTFTLSAIAMGLIAAWTVSPRGVLDYLRITLPAHAASEISWPFQYSATYAAHFFGAPNHTARALGILSYVAMVGLGLWTAPLVARRLRHLEMLAFIPALCAVIGGPFIHSVEIPAAIPAALVFAIELSGTLRAASGAALCLLIVPWIKVWAVKKLFASSLLVCGLVLLRLGLPWPQLIVMLGGLGAAIYVFELVPPLPLPVVSPGSFTARSQASDTWARFVAAMPAQSPLWFAIKLPTWAGLISALAVAITIARRQSLTLLQQHSSQRSVPSEDIQS